MTAAAALTRLGTFLFWLAAAVFVGTIAELLTAKHWQEPIQLLPFALCIAGLATLIAGRVRTGRGTMVAARVVMVIVAASSLLGVYMHLQGNLGFVQETRPGSTGWALWSAVLTGRAPAGASGVLVVAALLALASLEATMVAAPKRSAIAEMPFEAAGRSARAS